MTKSSKPSTEANASFLPSRVKWRPVVRNACWRACKYLDEGDGGDDKGDDDYNDDCDDVDDDGGL